MQATNDWAACLNHGGQTDILFLDFSKAFDKVSHAHLAVKLKYYGITGKSLEWIQSFLRDRKQCVSVNGQHSDWSDVLSGVPQGSVIGPTLFLLYINDIADQIQSTVRLFADDSVIYREIHNQHDIDTLQQDLETAFAWARTWKMKFNASKCQHLSVTKKRKPKNTRYSVDGQSIDKVSSSKYLGVTLNGTLTWSDHIAAITSKANSTLGILRRNLSPCTAAVKDRAYKALVRPQLDYASAAWSPYQRTASVSAMMYELQWDTLSTRRLLNQLSIFHKIHHHLVSIPFPPEVQLITSSSTRHCHPFCYSQLQPRIQVYQYAFYPSII